MSDLKIRPIAVLRVAAVLAGVALLLATALSSRSAPAQQSESFWGQVFFRAVSAEHYDSLSDMTGAADLVVAGTIIGAEPSRSWVAAPELGDDGVAYYAKLTIKVDENLAGIPATETQGTVALEVFLTRWKAFPEFAASLPREQAIFFLRRKTDIDRPFYRLVALEQGYIRDFGHAEPPTGASDPWLTDLSQLDYADVLGLVRAAASR